MTHLLPTNHLALVRFVTLSLFAGSVALLQATADEPARETRDVIKIPDVFQKPAPGNVKELHEIEDHIKKLLKIDMPVTVGIQIGPIQGSGVIVSMDGFVLTAGHVSADPGRNATIILPDGTKLKAKTLGNNRSIDSGMMQITSGGDYPYVDMASSASVKKGDWVIALGHPGGYQKGRSPVVRLGKVLEVGKDFIRTDCALVGGDSGGPLFDMSGRVIGIHSRIGDSLRQNVHVPVDTYRDTWTQLARGEEFGGGQALFKGAGKGKGKANSDPYIGLKFDYDVKNCRILLVVPNSPADSAGVKADDVVTKINDTKIASREDLWSFMNTARPNQEITMEVQRGRESVSLHVTIGTKPG